jgi:hypothetical protein
MTSLIANGPPRDAELHTRWEEVHELQSKVETLLGRASDESINWRPSPGKWSIAQHIDHLSITWAQYKPVVSAAVEDGCARGVTGAGPFRRSVLMSLFLRFLEPPPRRRAKAPAKFVPPAASRTVDEVRREFTAGQVELARLLLRADGLNLAKLHFSSPVSSWLRMSLGEALAVLNAHARRHLWHCEEILRTR